MLVVGDRSHACGMTLLPFWLVVLVDVSTLSRVHCLPMGLSHIKMRAKRKAHPS
ncbi:unnamed protein product [Amoebophrya sp. A25]|nr:unnamed protein product [Amoebophrya sp. A25]|eukprot:GSA25T00021303001.1